ncbi:sterol desaturase family protein [Legionella fallonii]|uniref:Putative fatty acid hydroxylase n=1 Tax=Legionella fallonii LLAP-10 TaxID=1212491 RepID=A0A098G4D0_9GAMM|nr:sterol desaturase family protein [Legionella fallonii]CEG57327.1 putative fatty acid hydroxylase [Legionella fallonii LLAP-10]
MNSLRSDRSAVSKLDKFNYYGDFFLLPLIVLGDLFYIINYCVFDILVILSFIAGVILYGAVIEYGFHRYVYHGKIRTITRLHLIHHKFPKSYISSPPYVTAIILFVFHLLFINVLGVKLGCALAAGITFGYLWYISIHHLIHHVSYNGSRVLNYFKREHLSHHEHAKINYCVSQPIWNTLYRWLS